MQPLTAHSYLFDLPNETQSRNQNVTTIPTWNIGDFWLYEADIYSNTEYGVFDLTTTDLLIEVIDMSTILHDGRFEQVYQIDISANITGEIQSSILSGDITGEITGNASLRKADLSLILSNISISGIIEYLIIFESDFFMKSYAEYYPRFEYFDFPLKTNEEWNTSTTAYQESSFYVESFFPENSSAGNVSMNGYAECGDKESITVPAGSFNSFHIISESNGSIESWYAPEVRSMARMYINNSNATETSRVWMNLSDYMLHDQQVNISASFSPLPVNVGEPVTISGSVLRTSDGTALPFTDVTIYIPYTNTTFLVPTDVNGFFTKTFVAPLLLDSTNTSYDIGSDGVIISVDTGTLKGTRILTLTVIGIAIDEVNAFPSVQYETLAVNISCRIYSVETLISKTVTINGPSGFTPINTSLLDAGNDKYYFNQPYSIIGTYTYWIWVKDTIGNTYQSAQFSFTIIPDNIPPTIEDIQADPDVQWETYPITIQCNVTDNVAVSTVSVLITDPNQITTNQTMTPQNDTYSLQSSYQEIGTYDYQIWAKDTLGNTKLTSVYHFTILEDAQAPEINDITIYPNPQWESYPVNISSMVTDNVEVSSVNLLITDPLGFQTNQTMQDGIYGYHLNQTYDLLGVYQMQIWANDTLGNQNLSALFEFIIRPQIPNIQSISVIPNPQVIDGWVNISCNVIDNEGIDTVKIHVYLPNGTSLFNQTMNRHNVTNFYYLDNYSVNGSYNFQIWANDTSGYTNTSSLYTFIILNQSYYQVDLSLVAGWNLLTVPVQNGWNASDLADNISGCLSVSMWDSVNQTYNTYIPGWPDFDFPLVDGCGYFVDTDSSGVLVCSGQLIGSVSVALEVGWNLIGWYHENDTLASSIAGNISGCLSVSMWDSVNQTYNTYIPGWPDFDFIVSRGMGLFVDVDQQSIWHGQG